MAISSRFSHFHALLRRPAPHGPQRHADRLILRSRRPGIPDESNPIGWALVREGLVIEQGASIITGLPAIDLPVTLLLHGDDCTLFDVAAPKGIRPHEWGLLLEDNLLQDPQQVHIACIGRGPGRLQLAVLARELVERWRACCAEQDLRIGACWVDFQLMPDAVEGQCLVYRENATLRLKSREAGIERWLCWPAEQLEHLPPDLIAGVRQWSADDRGDSAWATDLPLAEAQPVNLWPGGTPSRIRPGGSGSRLKCPLALATACAALLACLHFGLQFWQQVREAGAYRAAVAQHLGWPERRLDTQRVERTLARVQALQAQHNAREREQQHFAAAVSHWLAEQGQGRIKGWALDERQVRFAIATEARRTDPQLAVQIAQGMGAAPESVAVVESPDGLELHYTFTRQEQP